MATPRSANRDLARAFALVFALTAWNQLSDLLSEHYHLDAQPLASASRLGAIALGALITCGGIVGLGCVVWGGRSLRELGWTWGARPARLVGLGLGLTALVVGLVFAAYFGLAGADGVRGLAASMSALPLERRLFFLVMGAKVAFVEETVFRGDLLRALTPRAGRVGAVIVSSLVFALFHRTLEPVPLFMKLVFGLVFATATVRSRSLWPAAIAHTGMWAIVADN